jgi:hypothetical protein
VGLASQPAHPSPGSLVRRPGHAAIAVGSLWIGFWSTEPNAADCDAAAASILALERAHGRPVSVLAVLGRGVKTAFGAESRAASTRSSAAIRNVMGRGAVLIEHEGVVASIVASAATGIMILARVTAVRVFTDPVAGTRWIGEHAGLDSGLVVRTLEQLRAHADGAHAAS